MMNWKTRFEQKILNRGHDYFHEGAIQDFDMGDGMITATVSGTETYAVQIYIENDEIEAMYCSCPYAEAGKNCKHMAAVLYQWDSCRVIDRDDAAAVIEQADEEEIRAFLADILSNDQEMLAKFKSHSGQDASAKEINESADLEHETDYKQDSLSLEDYRKFYPHKVVAIKELRANTGMELDEAKNAIEELFCEIEPKNEELFHKTEPKNEEPTRTAPVVQNKYTAVSYSSPKHGRGCGASLRLLNLKFWIFLTGLLVLVAVVGIFHSEIDTGEAMIRLLVSVPAFLLLMKRHTSLKQYYDSVEYGCKMDEKRSLEAKKKQQKREKQQRKEEAKRVRRQTNQASEQKSSGSGCCLVTLFLLIFYVPIKIIADLTKKYH